MDLHRHVQHELSKAASKTPEKIEPWIKAPWLGKSVEKSKEKKKEEEEEERDGEQCEDSEEDEEEEEEEEQEGSEEEEGEEGQKEDKLLEDELDALVDALPRRTLLLLLLRPPLLRLRA
jgi:TATA-binding protein-associated factor Taf7